MILFQIIYVSFYRRTSDGNKIHDIYSFSLLINALYWFMRRLQMIKSDLTTVEVGLYFSSWAKLQVKLTSIFSVEQNFRWSWPLFFQLSKTSDEVGLFFFSSAKLQVKLAFIFSVEQNFSWSRPLFFQFSKTSVEVGLYFSSSAKLQVKLTFFFSVQQNFRWSWNLFSQLS